MEIIQRPIRSRELLVSGAAALAALVGGKPIDPARTPLVGQRMRGPRIGCGGAGCGDCVACDAMEAARVSAAMCGVNRGAGPGPNMQANIQGRSPFAIDPSKLTPDNCERYGLRYVPIGVSNPDAIVAGADSLTIELRANFLPYLHVVTPASTAKNVNFTQIDYQIQPMFIGGVVNGEMFISTATNGGYRLPTKRWLGNNDVITYSFNALAGFAPDALQIMAYGFTDAFG